MRTTDDDDPKSGPTVITVVVFTLLTVASVLYLNAYFGRVQEEEFTAKVVDRESAALDALRLEQEVQLSEYRWVDRDQNVVAIPIERAMELVASEMGDAPISASTGQSPPDTTPESHEAN